MGNMVSDNELYQVAEFLRVDEDQLDLLAEVLEVSDIAIPADPTENPGLMREIARAFRTLREERGGDCELDDHDLEVRESYSNDPFSQVVRRYAGPGDYGAE